MVWLALNRDFKSIFYVVSDKLNGQRYQELLTASLLPLCQDIRSQTGKNPIFQHDNASAHSSASTKQGLMTIMLM